VSDRIRMPDPDPDHPGRADIQPSPPKNKGGAPRGNRNALKHGFYARKFKQEEVKDLDRRSPELDDEIKLLRVYMRRVAEQADSFTSLDQGMEFLRALSLATYTISRLLKTRSALGPPAQDLLLRSMDEAIEAIRLDRGWK
jgi:uncharacterized protein YjcR